MVRRSPELVAVMERVLRAIEQHDVESLRLLFESGEHTVIIGSDPKEWGFGPNAVGIFLWQVERYPSIHYAIKRMEAFEDGAIGWAVSEEVAEFPSGDEVPLRKTAVFHLEGGIWRVIHWHASVLEPDDPEVMGIEISRRMAELLESIDVDAEAVSVSSALETSTVTLVFTDIEDSTGRTAEAGDQEWGNLIQGHFSDIARIAQRHHGVVVKTIGDGAVMAFDSSRGGLEAAIDVQRAASGGPAASEVDHRPFRIRVGVNTGDAVRAGGDYFGQMVNKTARIAAAASPGQVLVSDVVRGLIGGDGDVAFGDPLTLALKGFPGTHTVYPVII